MKTVDPESPLVKAIADAVLDRLLLAWPSDRTHYPEMHRLIGQPRCDFIATGTPVAAIRTGERVPVLY